MLILNKILKRLFDIFCSIILIFIFIPIWIFFPILIKSDSSGPVFYLQRRRTKNGKIFKMIKFRTMIVNAENIGTKLFSYKDDPRVTRVGKFLRKTSIDELPQLFNILCGQMSFVGPRPCVENELGDFYSLNKRFMKRFSMKAGITGLAQVIGRNDIGWNEKVFFDNMYIDNFAKYGVFYDISLLFRTMKSVFSKDNIYENRLEGTNNAIDSAVTAQEEVVRWAHLPDEME